MPAETAMTTPSNLAQLYRPSLGLLTDLYQLTMGYGYWKSGLADRRAVFHLNFRKNPFGGGYAIAAGMRSAAEFLSGLHFSEDDITYLAEVPGNDGRPIFPAPFLDVLAKLRFSCHVDMVPEGSVVFAHEPLVRVTGPLLEAQLVETALLTLVNFETLIATRAARVREAAGADTVLEFGLRRAQGIDGGLSASRAAYVGGADGTSNVLAGRLFGIPVKGTHAHAWVMSFPSEIEAFEAYAAAMPNNCVFLVDTYDTVEGVKNAIRVGHALKLKGHRLAGVRLDSGDLADLSQKARALLDEAGFEDAAIVASNDLDETLIESLKHQGARIDVWGVGTKLVTAWGQPALGGVYKLGALMRDDGTWDHKIKLSEQPIKVSTPGILQVRRFEKDGAWVGDLVHDIDRGVPAAPVLVDFQDDTLRQPLPPGAVGRDLLQPALRGGKPVSVAEPLSACRERAMRERTSLPAAVRRFLNPHRYPVGLEAGLADHKRDTIIAARLRGRG
jgi:nicotinate phosphoribosyltransferase